MVAITGGLTLQHPLLSYKILSLHYHIMYVQKNAAAVAATHAANAIEDKQGLVEVFQILPSDPLLVDMIYCHLLHREK